MPQDSFPYSEDGLEDTLKILETDYEPGFDKFLHRIKSIPNATMSELNLLRLIVEFGQVQLNSLFFSASADLSLDVVDLNSDDDMNLVDNPSNWAVNFKYFTSIIDKYPWILIITDFFHDCTDTLELIDTEGKLLEGGDVEGFIQATGKIALDDKARDDLIHDQETRFTSRYFRLQKTGILNFLENMIADEIQYRHQALIAALPELIELDIKGLKHSLDLQKQALGELMTLLRQKISYEA
jgi:hypothetical protein